MHLYRDRTFLCLLCGGILIIIIAFSRPHIQDIDAKDIVEAEKFWILKAKNKGKYDLVALGDSRTYRSLSPDDMGKALPGLKIFNFGFSSGGLNSVIYKAGEKLLDNKGKKIIILGVTPSALTEPSSLNTQYLQESHRPQSSIFERVYLNPHLYFFSPFEHSLLKIFHSKNAVERVYSNEYHVNGWVGSSKIQEDTAEALSIYRDELRNFKVSKFLQQQFLKQVSFWSSHNYKIFAFRPPTSLAMQMLEDSLGGLNYNSFISEFNAAGGNWIKIDRNLYHSYDGSHLDKNSAIKLSELIGEEIRRGLR
jgi:hypothetical protein